MAKKAFITGGSHGIGRGIAQVLSDEGYDIAFTYNNRKEDANALVREIEAKGRRVFAFHASLDEDHIAEPVTLQAIEALGGIDLMVCNAGRTITHSFLDLTEEDIDYLYHLNFRSYLICGRTAARYMVTHGVHGSLVFIASTRGIRAYPTDTIYGGMKAGLIRGIESIALELSQYGIRINCIAPGNTMITDKPTMADLTSNAFQRKIPLGRSGHPHDIGHMVSFLASDKASYITGDTIKIDGGLILPGMPEDGSPEAGYGWGKKPIRSRYLEEHPKTE